MTPKNNGTGMNSSRPSLLYLSTALFLALICLIDSNIGSGKKYMGIINDKEWKLLGIFIRNITPFKLIWYEDIY
jgi:hypothetical protein